MIEIKTVPKPRPFNLEKALAGEHVKLRNGRKAMVINALNKKEIEDESYELIGVLLNQDNKAMEVLSWDVKGNYFQDEENSVDIVSMWEEDKTKTLYAELPLPLKKPETSDKGIGVCMEIFFSSEEERKAWSEFFKWLEKYRCEP